MSLNRNRRRALIVAATVVVGAVAAVVFSAQSSAAAQGESITVTGCLERDAAARTPVYKLIARAGGGIQQFRLTAPANIDLAAELGHTIEVSGTLSRREAAGREEASIAVRQLRKISDSCS